MHPETAGSKEAVVPYPSDGQVWRKRRADAEGDEVRTKEVEFRSSRLHPELIDKHDYTENCEACRHKKAKLTNQATHERNRE